MDKRREALRLYALAESEWDPDVQDDILAEADALMDEYEDDCEHGYLGEYDDEWYTVEEDDIGF